MRRVADWLLFYFKIFHGAIFFLCQFLFLEVFFSNNHGSIGLMGLFFSLSYLIALLQRWDWDEGEGMRGGEGYSV